MPSGGGDNHDACRTGFIPEIRDVETRAEGSDRGRCFVNANSNSAAPTRIDGGKWQANVGNTVVYRSDNQWVVTVSKNGGVSIAKDSEFMSQANLTSQSANAVKSTLTCGVCLVPGFYRI